MENNEQNIKDEREGLSKKYRAQFAYLKKQKEEEVIKPKVVVKKNTTGQKVRSLINIILQFIFWLFIASIIGYIIEGDEGVRTAILLLMGGAVGYMIAKEG